MSIPVDIREETVYSSDLPRHMKNKEKAEWNAPNQRYWATEAMEINRAEHKQLRSDPEGQLQICSAGWNVIRVPAKIREAYRTLWTDLSEKKPELPELTSSQRCRLQSQEAEAVAATTEILQNLP